MVCIFIFHCVTVQTEYWGPATVYGDGEGKNDLGGGGGREGGEFRGMFKWLEE